MRLSRRGVLAGAAATGAAAGLPGWAASSAARKFTVVRDGSEIGAHRVTVARSGGRVRVDVEAEVVVRVLGVAAYRYEIVNSEVWEDELLQSLESHVNDDGEEKRVLARREGGKLLVEATDYTGEAPGDAGTTSYFAPDHLARGVWISTDNGELFDISAAEDGRETVETRAGAVRCARWRVTNGSDFNVTLFYTDEGEWASAAFDARGEPAHYLADDLAQSLVAVWRG